MFKKNEKNEKNETIIFESPENPQVRLQKEEEGEKIISSRELFPVKPDVEQVEAAKLRKNGLQGGLSREERAARDGIAKRKKKDITTIIARNYKRNPDLRWLFLAIVALFTTAFFVAKVYYGLSTAEIKTNINDYLMVLGGFIVGLFGLFNKILNGEGALSKGLREGWVAWRTKEVEKKDLDLYGHTIIEDG